MRSVALDEVFAVHALVLNATLVLASSRWQLRIAIWAKEPEIRWPVVFAVSVNVIKRQHDRLSVPEWLGTVHLADRVVALIGKVLLLAPIAICTTDRCSARGSDAVFEDLCGGEAQAIHVMPNV